MLVSAAVLQQSNATTTVTLASGELIDQDRPFADTKEQLGGTFVVDVTDFDAATDGASRAPSVVWGHFEINALAGSWEPRYVAKATAVEPTLKYLGA